jgi:hypothetical protein
MPSQRVSHKANASGIPLYEVKCTVSQVLQSGTLRQVLSCGSLAVSTGLLFHGIIRYHEAAITREYSSKVIALLF